jgi:hypothetical protein
MNLLIQSPVNNDAYNYRKNITDEILLEFLLFINSTRLTIL